MQEEKSMKVRTMCIVAVFALCALAAAAGIVSASKPSSSDGWTTPQMIGRYQMVPVSGVTIHVCDTTTGEVWTNSQDHWQSKGKPPRE
jgi:hypothetical protein